MELQQLIESTAVTGAANSMQALALAKQAGMINSESDLQTLIQASMETMLEDFATQLETTIKQKQNDEV